VLFNSHVFIFVFLPIVLAVWWARFIPTHVRLVVLTGASYVFYGYWEWRFVGLMFLSTVVDFWAGHLIDRAPTEKSRRFWLVMTLVANLGLLAFFKYSGFFASVVNDVSNALSGRALVPPFSIVLPIGISFYTFQSLSYSIDIYRRQAKPAASFLHFAAYVSWFPHLVAGPIVRYGQIDDQLRHVPVRLTWQDAGLGIQFFVLGLCKKLLIADPIATQSDALLLEWQNLGLVQSWEAMLGYTLQIYFDFSGYSDMAVGLGYLIGFRFPQNFDSPYKSATISDFWRRWHMSLSGWLRDYLYIPLGGNRDSKLKAARNLIITMFLGGLWHGAAWTFVVWGVYHGVLLAIGQAWRSLSSWRLPHRAAVLLTFVSVVVGWVFFRSTSFTMAGHLLKSMVGLHGVDHVYKRLAVQIAIGLAICWMLPNTWQLRPFASRWRGVALGLLAAACVLLMSKESPFLYFQF